MPKAQWVAARRAPAVRRARPPRRTRWRPHWIRISLLAFCLGFWWLFGWGVVRLVEMIHGR